MPLSFANVEIMTSFCCHCIYISDVAQVRDFGLEDNLYHKLRSKVREVHWHT